MIRRCIRSISSRNASTFSSVCASHVALAAPSSLGMMRVHRDVRRHLCTSDSNPPMTPKEALHALHSACEKELCEEQASEHLDIPAPEGWAYHHTPGTGYFTLQRDTPFPMEIFCRIEDPKPEGGNRSSRGHTFVVRMTRNQRTCELSCVAEEDELEVHDYRVFPEVRSRDDFLKSEPYFSSQLTYEGPDLGHMDETFMQTLFESLESFGINDALASYMIKRCEATEQQEYEKWLSELKQFTA